MRLAAQRTSLCVTRSDLRSGQLGRRQTEISPNPYLTGLRRGGVTEHQNHPFCAPAADIECRRCSTERLAVPRGVSGQRGHRGWPAKLPLDAG